MTTTSPSAAEQTTTASGETRSRTGLRGTLGVASIVFMVVAAASPLGVIGGPVALGIATGNGIGFPATYVVVTVVLLLFAVGFTTMTPHVRDAGAFSSYVEKGFGRGAGLGAGFVALIAYITLEAAVYGLLGPGLDSLLVLYGLPSLPWWLYAAVGFVIVAFLGYHNISLSGKVLAILLVAEVVIVIALDIVVIAVGGPEGYSTGIASPTAFLSGAPGLGILFAILSFIGFEATAVFRDEAKNPQRTIPRATYLSLALIGIFYAVSSWVLVTAVGDSKAVETATERGDALLTDITLEHLGQVGTHIVQVLFVTSLFACILSFHNIVSRYVFSLSNRGALPAGLRLDTAHARHGSPARASIATTVVVGVILAVIALTGVDPLNEFYTWFAGFSSLGVALLLTTTSLAVLVFFRRNRGLGSWWSTLVAPGIGLLGLLGLLALIVTNLPSLVGDSVPLAVGIAAVLVAAFVLGTLLARRTRHSAASSVDREPRAG